MGKDKAGFIYVLDVKCIKGTPARVKDLIMNTAVRDKADYGNVTITIPQDPGQAGKGQAQDMVRMLSGFNVKTERPTGDKVTRASGFSAQCEVGNVYILTGDWNSSYLRELESFPEGKHDDMVDASADSFNQISVSRRARVRELL
jgi:predicted phage terminase large subunit-like protein